MSSLYKRKLKTGEVWYGKVKLRNGAWKDFNTNASSKREAKEMVAGIESEIAAGRDPFLKHGDGGETIGELSKRYLAEREQHWSARTKPLHDLTLRMLIKALGDIDVTAIGREEVSRFTRYLREHRDRTPSPATVNIDLRNLSAFLNWAKTECGLRDWEIPLIPKLKAPEQNHRDYYTPEECERLVRAASEISINGDNFGHYIALLLLTGLRKREALSLNWEQVDNNSHMILLEAERTKAKRADTIPVSDEVEKLLHMLPSKRKDRLWRISAWSGYIDECWDKAIAEAGIRRLKLHNCRDTFAVNHLLEGVPLAVVSRLLRHRDISTTMRNYAAFSTEDIGAILRRRKPIQKPGTFSVSVLRALGMQSKSHNGNN